MQSVYFKCALPHDLDVNTAESGLRGSFAQMGKGIEVVKHGEGQLLVIVQNVENHEIQGFREAIEELGIKLNP